MIFLFTGNGKGKTTASIGMGVRAAGHNKRVVMIKFMKGIDSGEDLIKIPNFEIYKFGRKEFVNLKNPAEEDKKLAREGFEFAKKIAKEKPFLLILDEINVAVHIGLLDKEEVINFVKDLEFHVVLTGRYAPKEFIDLADLVTEMKEIKHPYEKGRKAEEGIEW